MTDLESFGTKALLLLVVSCECTDSTNLLCILQENMHEQSLAHLHVINQKFCSPLLAFGISCGYRA